VLATAGYRTGLVGKGHLDVHHLTDSPDTTAGWDDPSVAARWSAQPYYGFAEQARTCGHNRAAGHYGAWLYENYPDAVPLLEKEQALAPPIGSTWQSALPVELHSSTYVGDRSVAFIRRHAGRAPFFLWASFPDPHPPICPPQPYADRYDPASMPLPTRQRGEMVDKPPHFRGEVDGPFPDWRPYGDFQWADEARRDDYDRVLKAYYYGMISLVDANVGRILDALEETGQLDNTVVIYLSDHGEQLGDHWLDGKGPWHYDGCTRIPFMLRYPRLVPAGRVVDDFVSLCDLAPTICDLADVPYTTWPPLPDEHPGGCVPADTLPDVQGISLLPALRGDGPARPHVLIEYEWRWIPGLHQKTLRTSDWRITVYAGRPYGELYDLRADPDEFVNCWQEPALRAMRGDLIALLLNEVMRTEGRLPARVAPN
jgi:arylsulfatase A-like enzyme